MSITPITAAQAVLLESRASGAPALVPITGATDPEIARLVAIKLERGSIPEGEYHATMRATGTSKRTPQRQVKELLLTAAGGALPTRQRFALNDHHKQVIMACGGNVQLAYTQLTEAGEDLPCYETFWRALDALPTGIKAYLRKGAEGLVGIWFYPPYQAPARNEVWQADHFELPVDVVADGHTTRLVKPWLTVFEDDATRKIMGWAIVARPGERPGADVIRAVICDAVRIRLEHEVEVGGVPRILRWDNDRAFNAGSVIQLGTAIGFEAHAVPPYSGHMKGKVERLGRRIQEEFCVLQPGYTHGPTTYTGKDLFRDTPPMTAAELRARLGLWFAEYDQKVHQGIGRSPIAAWAADETPLRRASDEQLRSALLVASREYTVAGRKGVHFAGQWWQGAGMTDVVGRKVEVRYPINNDSFIEIYYEGRWVATGWPALSLTEDQKKEIWDGRRESYAQMRALHAQAREIRVGADARALVTDATPSVASMPAIDRLASSAGDLYALLGRAEGLALGEVDAGTASEAGRP